MKRYLFVAVLLILFLLLSGGLALASGRVLLVSSYHPAFPTFFQQIDGVKSVFKGQEIVLDVEFMDSKRFFDPVNLANFHRSLAYKLSQQQRYDLVMTSDDNALNFALQHREELFPETPVIFLGVNNLETALAQNENPWVTGVVEAVSMRETLELMLRLHPAVKNIVALVDATPSGQGDLQSFYRAGRQLDGVGLSDISLVDQSFPQFTEKLKSLDSDSAVLLLSAYRDKYGKNLLFPESLQLIKENLTSPLYHLWLHGMGDGVLGGKLISHFEQGKTAAEIALAVLGGEPVSSLQTRRESPNRYLFDHRELQRFGISRSLLPEGSEIQFEPHSFYRQNKRIIWSVAALFTTYSLLLIALGINIVRRRRFAHDLKASERRFHTLFDHSFHFVALLGSDGRLLKANQTALSFRALAETDVVGVYFWDTPWWKHSETLVAQLKDAFTVAAGGQVARFEVHSTEVRDIYLDVSLKPVLDDSGKLIYLIAEARDITEIRLTEQELQQAQKMESVGTLAGGIAHDFNNILGGILGSLTLIQLKQDKGELTPDKLQKYLDMLSSSAYRAKDIINQLLTLSRKYELQFSPLNLRQLLENVCQIAQTTFDKSIRIDARVNADYPVQADASSLEQVFLNVCINAAHAMTFMRPEGEPWGGDLLLAIEKQQIADRTDVPAGAYWHLSIQDTGVGIAPEELTQIFVPFYTTKEEGGGSGLGLSMVYNIVRQHKGFVEVQSQVGVGSSFDIYLPVLLESVDVLVPEDGETELQSGHGTVLVIDDEELIRSNAQEILQECGYEVRLAADGQQGVAVYRQYQDEISLVLLDLVMPVLSGKETFQQLQAIDPKVKVLLSSGFRHDQRVDEILQAGAAGFIQKPYALYKLSKAIKSLL